MKKSIAIAIIGTVAFLAFAGCANTPALLRALAKDPATVSVRIGTPWGTQMFTRVGGTTNSVTVSPDGSVTVGAAK